MCASDNIGGNVKQKKIELPKISEFQHQCKVIEWCKYNLGKYPMLKWIYAIPNEGKHKVQYRIKQKRMGLNPGVPDLCLPYPIARVNTYTWHGLFIEMKTKGGRVSSDQKEWIAYLKSVNYQVDVAWSAYDAIAVIKEYLG